jgi:type I restriction enzyme S subunit
LFAEAYFFQEGPGIRNWQFRSQGIKLLNVQNIVINKLILNNTDKYIDEEEYKEKYLHFTIQENDLLYASSGGSWGKSAFFSNPGYKVIVNTSTIRIHPYVSESSRTYLKSFLDSNFFKNQMIKQLVGMQPNFGSTHFLKILVPIPPANEQVRIAEKIAELNSLCDKLEEEQTNNLTTHQQLVKSLLDTLTQAKDSDELQSSWERISEHFDTLFCTDDSIDQLKKMILQLAAMGKLTKQEVNDELGSVLLEKVYKEKEELAEKGLIKKPTKASEVPATERPFNLPEAWVWARLSDTGIGSTGKTPSTSVTKYFGGDIPFIGPGQISENGTISDSDKTLTQEGSEYSTIANAGDIVMVCIGGSIGKCAIVTSKITFNQQLNSISPIIFDSQYLYNIFNAPFFKEQILKKATGTATPIINRGKWEEIVVPVPPLKEQARIVSKINEMFKLCDSLIENLKKAQTIQELLSKTIIEYSI